jgi:hypothetical protein
MKRLTNASVLYHAPKALLGVTVGIFVAMLSHSPRVPLFHATNLGMIAALGTVGTLSIRWDDQGDEPRYESALKQAYREEVRAFIAQAAIEADRPMVDLGRGVSIDRREH